MLGACPAPADVRSLLCFAAQDQRAPLGAGRKIKKREGDRMVLGAEPGAGRQRERLAVLLCVLPSGSFACERRRGRKGKKGEEEKKK